MTRLHWIAIGTVFFGGTAVALVVNDGSLLLQRSTPGKQQVGHVNVSGRIRAGKFSGVASGVTNIPADALTGTIADARLSSNVAKLGSTQVLPGQTDSSKEPPRLRAFQPSQLLRPTSFPI